MTLCSCFGSINFADTANIRKVCKELMSKVRNEAIYISSKYKIQIEPIQFEWDMFLPTLEEDFPEILNEILSHSNKQQQQLNSNENRNTANENRNQYSKRL